MGEFKRETMVDLSKTFEDIDQLQQFDPLGPDRPQPKGLTAEQRIAGQGLLRVKQPSNNDVLERSVLMSSIGLCLSSYCDFPATASLFGQQP